MEQDNWGITFVTWQQVQRLVGSIANIIKKDTSYKSIYGVPRGGMVVAVMLSHKTGLPIVSLDEICEDTIVVDDIADSGHTIKEYQSMFDYKAFATLHTRVGCDPKPDYSAQGLGSKVWLVYPWEDKDKARRDRRDYLSRRC